MLAAPILFIVIGLLASADRIFLSWIAEVPGWFTGLSIGEGIGRIILAVAITLYTFCYMWGLLFPKVIEALHPFDSTKDETAAAVDVVRSKPLLDPITAGTLLVCVNVVYVLFAIIQFSYLFGAADGLYLQVWLMRNMLAEVSRNWSSSL